MVSTIGKWLLGILTLAAIAAAALWAWLAHRKGEARDEELIKSAEELAAAKKREQAGRVEDAGAEAAKKLAAVKAKGEEEARKNAADHDLVDHLGGWKR